MPKASPILRKGQKALQDLNLLKILNSEITHELSSNRFQVYITGECNTTLFKPITKWNYEPGFAFDALLMMLNGFFYSLSMLLFRTDNFGGPLGVFWKLSYTILL